MQFLTKASINRRLISDTLERKSLDFVLHRNEWQRRDWENLLEDCGHLARSMWYRGRNIADITLRNVYIYTDTLKCTLKHTHTNTQRLTVTSTSSHSGPPSHIVIRNSMLTSFPCLRLWDCFMAITSNHKAWLWPWEWLSHWATVHTIPPVTMKRGHKTPLKLMIMYETCSPWQSPLVSNPPPPFLAPLLRVMDFMKWCLTEYTKFD